MSVFSIIQRSQQQQFSLQTNGAPLPKVGTATGNRTKDAEAKSAEKAKDLADSLTETTTPQSEEAQDEAEKMVEEYKDAVDLNSSLSRAVKDNADAERELRIERMAQQIKRMKEALRFATPEKAKQMLRELQQIAKNFRTASIELRKAAEKIGPDRPNMAVDVAADATSHAIQTKIGSSDVTPDDLAAAAGDLASSLFAAPPASMAAPADTSAGDAPVRDMASLLDPGALSDFATELQETLLQKKDAAFYQSAVHTYADLQHQSDSLYRKSRIDSMRGEHGQLLELFEEIKLLADSLETLVDKEDEQVQEAMTDIGKKLAEGYEILDNDDLQRFLQAGRYAPVAGLDTGTQGASGITVSVSSISVETTVSISVSGVIA
ncbi:hypothetical protein [uncultured Roseibium sp.]|uniref:hypothetical protein n=1 Tax=uncultured Roseibium sp. TaxID=1936171 RepID=UPI00321719DE